MSWKERERDGEGEKVPQEDQRVHNESERGEGAGPGVSEIGTAAKPS